MPYYVSQQVLDAMLRHPELAGRDVDAEYIFGKDVVVMPSPTVSDVHVPTAIGNKKGKPKMAGKKAMDSDGDQDMGKKKAAMGKVPPQFLPKQKGKAGSGKPAAKGKPFGKKK